MGVIGHFDVLSALVTGRYPVVLLTGPDSVGKWVLAEEAARSLADSPMEIIRYLALSADSIRMLISRSWMLTELGARCVLLCLDDASEQAQNMLLKFLEEPPPGIHVIMTSSTGVLPTIRSRAQCFSLGLLTDDQVRQVLVQNGMSAEAAARQAPLGGGRVRPAMDGVNPQARSQVIAVLRALSAGSSAQLDTALREWSAEAHHLLASWAAETSSGRPRVFAPDSAPVFTPLAARRVLRALGTAAPQAAPRLCAHAALAPLCLNP